MDLHPAVWETRLDRESALIRDRVVVAMGSLVSATA
jgi:hypothetical protein